MTAQSEKDIAKYQRYTEKRYNTERFVEEMEMKKEFPELSAALEIEREQLLKLSKDKIDDRRKASNILRGKDIVYELLEQSLVHEELDKIRRDLDEFAYKQRDASHLLNLPFVNPETSKAYNKPSDMLNYDGQTDIKERHPVTEDKGVSADLEPKNQLIKLQNLPVLDFTEAPTVDKSDLLVLVDEEKPAIVKKKT